MKKFNLRSKILALCLLLVFSVTAFAGSSPKLQFSVVSNNKDVITVKTGDTIDVSVLLTRTDSDESIDLQIVEDDLEYDSEFFEPVGKAVAESHNGRALASFDTRLKNNQAIVSFSELLGTYSKTNTLVTFKLKVKASEGASVIKNSEVLVYDNSGNVVSDITQKGLTVKVQNTLFEGSGTETDPYLLKTTADLKTLSSESKTNNFSGKYFKFANDITIPSDWDPIGGTTKAYWFAGTIDGDGHLLTIEAGGKALLGYTSNATLKNLNIYGSRIESNGVVVNYTTGVSNKTCITIENVNLKSGTKTLGSGYISGYASGSFVVVIKNCEIETGVEIGYTGTSSNVGSFGGEYNGTIENCTSAAVVKGVDFVGGICGNKGQTMGDFIISGCAFTGKVQASGNYAGGISGAGYGGTNWGLASAPNAPWVTIKNCVVSGTVSGSNYVGGILGAEAAVYQCWDNGVGYLSDNTFKGTVSATAQNAYIGSIAGYIVGLDKYTIISDNLYSKNNGADAPFGKILYIDTNNSNHETTSGAIYIDSSDESTPLPTFKAGTGNMDPQCFTKRDQNRTDDPLGSDLTKLARLIGSSDNPTEPIDNPVKPIDNPTKTTITVYFTLLGDSEHGEGGTEHTLKNGGLQTWLSRKAYKLEAPAKVVDLLNKVSEENPGIVFNGASRNYVSTVTYNNVTIGEFDNGTNSGWMYTLNGTHPLFGVAEQSLKDGDAVVFHYTDNYHNEEGSEAWEEPSDNDKKDDKQEDQKKDDQPVEKEELVNPYTDIKSEDWFAEYVLKAYKLKLMNGVGNDRFDPYGTFNRAMVVTVLYRLEGSPTVTAENPFKDVPAGKWYTDAIIWAAQNKIVEGNGNGRFDPDSPVTREQFATILMRYCKFKGYDVTKTCSLDGYTDSGKISAWALDAMKWANAEKLITGSNNKLNPKDGATRAESATILVRLIENVIK